MRRRAESMPPSGPTRSAAATLRRWHDSGGDWVVVSGGESVTISLRRCDGGEEVDRIVSSDPSLLLLLAGSTSREHFEASGHRSSDPACSGR